MTLFISTNSIFQPTSKYIKFYNSEINVIQGANRVNCLPLSDVRIDYDQFSRLSIEIPKEQTDFVLSFPMLGLKVTSLIIKPIYNGTDPKLNYLKWKFQSSSDAKWCFTNILTFSGTSTNPIPPILIDNPNPDATVQLEILVTALKNDYLNDISAFLYLDGLAYTNIHTYNDEPNTGILSLFNKDGVLAGTIDINSIINFSRVAGKNRIIIDESSENNIVLDFLTEEDTLQALSAINYVLLDPINRFLIMPKDITSPEITYTPNVIDNQIIISLADYPLGFTKLDFINFVFNIINDDRDGGIIAVPNNITFNNDVPTIINIIVVDGTYTADISISDIAGNSTTDTINIIVTA